MVAADRIAKAAREMGADLVGLSGLITPSLDEMVHTVRELSREGITVPILIGGATTSPAHTAVKIAPAAPQPVVHVADASRAVGVAGSLLSDELRPAFLAKNAKLHEELRRDHAGRQSKPLLPLAAARARRRALDWAAADLPVPPFAGVRIEEDVPLADLIPFVDWSPFFHAWELRGRYPQILDDAVVGERARELFADAQTLLTEIVEGRLLQARAVWGLFPANSVGDDIELYADATGEHLLATIHTLRQQQEKSGEAPYEALADFVAPRESGRRDHLGLFAVTAGHGLPELCARFEADHDDYRSILAKALADRLAEAFAERLHKLARESWGFGIGEALASEDLIRERYRGIRPAPGYPACPDHTEKRTLFSLLDAPARAGITLTESCAMFPAASVSGFYLAHPDAHYFAVGRLGRDQVADYARRKGMPLHEAERWLGPNLGYEAERSATAGATTVETTAPR
jgi:5-methyltetrahydrofolate--homocysteine methyltransferase